LKADNFNNIFSKRIRADAMIPGSPTYFAAVSANPEGIDCISKWFETMNFLSLKRENIA